MVTLRNCLRDCMDLSWIDFTQIILMLTACWACFAWGKYTGIHLCVEALLHKKIITEADLERLDD